MNLNKIDFSDGIRPEEIQENFEMLQNQLNRERLGVGGFGVASGFEIEARVDTDIFQIRLSEASIIDEDGSELFIPATVIDIDPPELFSAYESCTINYNNTISLKQIPYAANRRMPAEFLTNKNPAYSGIYINYPSNNMNTDDYIRVSEINGTVLTVTGAISRDVVVRYRYTADRIDTIYLKDDNTIGVLKGTTSTTPSKVFMPADGKLLIAYIMIESRYVDENITIPSAHIYVKDDMRSLRNLYTDRDNNLWICGTLFDDLQIVHMREPKNPKENTLWLNTETNTLYYWKSTDGFVYHNQIVIDTDFVENKNANRDFATYMDFLLGEKELEVYHSKGNGESNRLIEGVHYYELYNELPTYNQNIPSKTEGNSFRIIEDAESGNGLTLNTGDVITYMIRFKDSHYMWVPINKMTYTNAKETKVYCTNDYMPNHRDGYFDSTIANSMGYNDLENDDTPYPYKYQYFIFDREDDLNMHFTPDRQELSIHVNQMVLHNDQFEEITVYDLLDTLNDPTNMNNKVPERVARTAAIYYGWTQKYLTEAANDFDNTGIGFKLIDPLDSGLNAESHGYLEVDGSNDLYLEAIVERRVCGGPFKRKIQRTATFVKEGIQVVDDFNILEGVFLLGDHEYYRYNEHQLEVFVNGRKLNKYSVINRDPELIEQYGFYLPPTDEIETDGIKVLPIDGSIDKEMAQTLDQGWYERQRSAPCTMFKIKPESLAVGDIITYKITTNVYSYEHVTNLLEDLEIKIDGGVANMNTVVEQFEDYKDEVDSLLGEMSNEIINVRNEVLSAKNTSYLDDYGKLKQEHLPEDINHHFLQLGQINTQVIYHTGDLDYANDSIREGDYLTVVHRNNAGLDRFLIPGADYYIQNEIKDGVYKGTYFVLTETNIDKFNEDDVIYITGIALGRVGR